MNDTTILYLFLAVLNFFLASIGESKKVNLINFVIGCGCLGIILGNCF